MRLVDDQYTAIYSFFQFGVQPLGRGRIACAEGLQRHAPESRCPQHAAYHLRLDAREELQHRHPGVKFRMQRERQVRVAIVDQVGLVGDVYAGLGQGGIVVAVEGREMLGVALGCAVGAEEAVLEVDRYLRHHGIALFVLLGRYLDSRQQVLTRIATQYAYGQLATREHHRFAQVLQHEAQRRGRITHRVGAVQDHEAVILLIVVIHHLGHASPTVGTDVRRVDHGVEGLDIHLYRSGKKFGHEGLEGLQVGGHQSAARLLTHHRNGATRRDQQYFAHPRLFVLRCKITKKNGYVQKKSPVRAIFLVKRHCQA